MNEKKTLKILITAKNIYSNSPGGVGGYYKALFGYFDDNIEYFAIGSRTDRYGLLESLTWLIWDYIRFVFKLLLGKYDIIHVNPSLDSHGLIRDGLFLVISKHLFKRKTIVFFRGWSKNIEKIIVRNYFNIFKKVFLKADCIITLGKEFAETIREWGYAGIIKIETTTVDDSLLNGYKIDKRLIKINKSTEFNILYLGRIIREKGVYEVVETYKLLKENNCNITLTIGGDGSDLKKLKNYVKSNNIQDILFTGYVNGERKRQIFENSEIFFLPTFHNEGMPNAILEAMAFGLPIVSRPVGGIKDFFVNGKMGYISDSIEPYVFADLILKIINDKLLMRKISMFNYEYAKKRFYASKVAQRITNIYKEL